MLPEFKKRIDTLRDILVGAVPSPAGQIEQITYALIYKFMSDIDDRAASIPGGKRTYFTGEYEKYGWHELMTPTLGAHDRLTLYREALGGLAKNPGLPELFQGIYQNAYLTFNDPRVLTLFLKEIDNFKHSNSDDIGDAYEYLLQITGAQGDVGQFRTPRHIIKFIVEAVNPTKSDSVLDPAVGTAGFLIAAYNHVKHHHDGVDEISGLPNENEQRLTSDELDKLHKNYHGFDIDPTMVRTAKVNMYLHGFKTPDIKNHDSLSSEDFWNERYDVILANPPFMSPKGGIKPHDKFGIVANRAEVLFVDYIASHLKPTGRAGIVVPEGIIFQSGKAYKELRKNLVENYLYAVVSLPAGVFQPYSGVKTSVLLLNKELARQRDEVLFIKIENDGYSLGAQRRKNSGDQFPEALKLIESFTNGQDINSEFAHVTTRTQIADSGDYNLTGERYRTTTPSSTQEWDTVKLGEIIKLNFGERITKSKSTGTLYPVYGGGGESFRTDNFNRENEYVVARFAMSESCVRYVENKFWLMDSGGSFSIKSEYAHQVDKDYVGKLLLGRQQDVYACARGGAQKNLNNEHFYQIEIPLPPIEIQRKIVAELDGYQTIIDATQTIIKTYKPTIKIDRNWGLKKVSEIAKLEYGIGEAALDEGDLRYVRITDITSNGTLRSNNKKFINSSPEANMYILSRGDILVARTGATFGKTLYFDDDETAAFAGFLMRFNFTSKNIDSKFFWYFTQSEDYWSQARSLMTGGGQPQFNAKAVEQIEIPLPSIDLQRQIVAELNAEQQLVDANIKLGETFQRKIKDKIAEIWGE